jgi:hypothetical protein
MTSMSPVSREFANALRLTSPLTHGQKVKDALGREAIVERFVESFLFDEDECWYWMGPIDRKGYGRFNTALGRFSAHRYSYMLWIGPIAEGLELDHLCRHRDCVNPAHLEAVTHRVNVLRSQAPPARQARQTHCKNGHPFNGDNLIIDSLGRRVCRACGLVRRANWRGKQDPDELRAYNAAHMRAHRARLSVRA